MKFIKPLICFFLAGILSSCLDSEEKIIINDDNSGMYTLSLDLSKILKFEASLGGKPNIGKLPRKLDSTIYLKNYLIPRAISPRRKSFISRSCSFL
jgi:hypothetical protein